MVSGTSLGKAFPHKTKLFRSPMVADRLLRRLCRVECSERRLAQVGGSRQPGTNMWAFLKWPWEIMVNPMWENHRYMEKNGTIFQRRISYRDVSL